MIFFSATFQTLCSDPTLKPCEPGADPEIKLTVAKFEKSIEKSGAVLGYRALSLLDALQRNRPTKCVCKLQTCSWRKYPGGAKPDCSSTLERQKPYFVTCISRLLILLGSHNHAKFLKRCFKQLL